MVYYNVLWYIIIYYGYIIKYEIYYGKLWYIIMYHGTLNSMLWVYYLFEPGLAAVCTAPAYRRCSHQGTALALDGSVLGCCQAVMYQLSYSLNS